MANKCLVTRLKAAIQNDDLPLFDTITLEVVPSTTTTQNNYRFGIITDGDVIVKANGNGYFANTYAGLSDETKRLTEITVNSSSTNFFYVKQDTFTISLINAHNLRALMMEGATDSNRHIIRLNLAELKNNPGITSLCLSQGHSYGNIADIPSTINDLMLSYCSDIYGNIASMASKNVFNGSGHRFWIGFTGISGSIEDFVAGQVSQGVEEYTAYKVGKISSTIFRKTLTIGGVTPSTDIYYLSWSGTNRIIAADKTPIDDATTIYAKGATAEEISAWQQAGKTVVVITDEDGE